MLNRYSLFFGCLFLALTPALSGQEKTKWVVLPETAAEQVKNLCSRPGPPNFNATWMPSDSDIQAMESRLSRISRLRSKSGILNEQIKHPDHYYRQYLGLVVNKRRIIYINALCEDSPPENWQQTVYDVCDGGCTWGVVYDVASGDFSDLEMNGVA